VGSELRRKLDYADCLAMPDDGKRDEIVQGDLYVTPSPSPLHEHGSRRLERQLEDFFHPRTPGEVFNAPIDLILASGDVVQPDLVVDSDPRQISKRGIEGAPLLVVEILSPATRKQDRGVKSRRYAEFGIAHYWIGRSRRAARRVPPSGSGEFSLAEPGDRGHEPRPSRLGWARHRPGSALVVKALRRPSGR